MVQIFLKDPVYLCGVCRDSLTFSITFTFTFQPRLPLVILVGGMGVEDQRNGLYGVWILLDVILFYGVGPKWKSTYPNQEHWWTAVTNCRDYCLCSSWFLKEECWAFFFQVAEVCARCWELQMVL